MYNFYCWTNLEIKKNNQLFQTFISKEKCSEMIPFYVLRGDSMLKLIIMKRYVDYVSKKVSSYKQDRAKCL